MLLVGKVLGECAIVQIWKDGLKANGVHHFAEEANVKVVKVMMVALERKMITNGLVMECGALMIKEWRIVLLYPVREFNQFMW